MTEKKPNYKRQKDIFDPETYNGRRIEVVGAGGIGSFTVVALAKLGLKNIRVWDGDKVEDHNVPNQFHILTAVGHPKVRALAGLTELLTGTKIKTKNKFWDWDDDKLKGIVIAAVDSMESTEKDPRCGRKELWESMKADPEVELFIDARLGGETIRVLSLQPVNDSMKYDWYEKSLFSPGEIKELPCTARSIIDVGYQVAAVITNLVRKFLKDGEVTHDIAISMKDLSIMKLEV